MARILDEKTKQMAEDFKNAILPIFGNHLKEIILYGSYARGDYHQESDIDFFILADENRFTLHGDKMNEISTATADLMLKYNTFFSFVPEKPSFFKDYSDSLPLFQNVIKDGIKIYG